MYPPALSTQQQVGAVQIRRKQNVKWGWESGPSLLGRVC